MQNNDEMLFIQVYFFVPLDTFSVLCKFQRIGKDFFYLSVAQATENSEQWTVNDNNKYM